MTDPDPRDCLGATRFIDAKATSIQDQVDSMDLAGRSPAERAVALFEFVRDSIAYDFSAPAEPDGYRASTILQNRRGHCVRKAVLLCALARAAKVPTALAFADMRDHTLSAGIVALLGTDVLHHHGLVAFHLDGQWLRADPTTGRSTSEEKGFRLVEFDGTQEALGHATTEDGRRHLEYTKFFGLHADLPFVEVMESLAGNYANANADKFGEMGLTTSEDFARAAKAYGDG